MSYVQVHVRMYTSAGPARAPAVPRAGAAAAARSAEGGARARGRAHLLSILP